MKRILKFIIPIALLLLLAGIAYKGGFISFRKFPKAEGAKKITLNCTYRGQKIQLEETLYQSINEYYSKNPKKIRLGYKSYVSSDSEDSSLKNLTQKIKAKGGELRLSQDQTMDLATCFVQNIPYDGEKAKIVLSASPADKVARATNREYYDRFPYETLYDNKGICTDKSYLEAAILTEMGYGTALLAFDKEKHMAVGVKTPSGYSSFSTGYSYIETTNTGFKVGQLPRIDENIGGARKAELENIQAGQDLIPDLPEPNFTPPSDIIKISDGREYERIVEITSDINRLKALTKEINTKNNELASYREKLKKSEDEAQTAKNDLSRAESEVSRAKNTYQNNPTDENYIVYTDKYSEYQNIYGSTKSVINAYNANVSEYNSLVAELNGLIDEYNRLIKSD